MFEMSSWIWWKSFAGTLINTSKKSKPLVIKLSMDPAYTALLTVFEA
jgi:hypothetical protein